MKKEKNKILFKEAKKVEEIKKIAPEIKEQTILLFTQQSDENAEIEARKRKEREKIIVEFLGGDTIDIDEYVLEVMATHETRFKKYWFYKLADLYQIDRRVMDTYVKPNFVRLFIIQFVYARFPYLLLRTLRSRNRKLGNKSGKLHQHLRKDAVEKLECVIKQVYDFMDISESPLDFKEKYCKEYKLCFQTELF